MRPPINPLNRKVVSSNPYRNICAAPRLIDDRTTTPSKYPDKRLMASNSLCVKNQIPHEIANNGKINELYPKVSLIKKYAIQTPSIPMGFSTRTLGEIPGSSLGL